MSGSVHGQCARHTASRNRLLSSPCRNCRQQRGILSPLHTPLLNPSMPLPQPAGGPKGIWDQPQQVQPGGTAEWASILTSSSPGQGQHPAAQLNSAWPWPPVEKELCHSPHTTSTQKNAPSAASHHSPCTMDASLRRPSRG